MKKFTSMLVVAAMLAAMLITMIPTASAAWDGSSVSAGLVGSGTEFDPYLISSENDLAFVAKQVNDAVTTYAGEYLKLTVDLDLGNHDWRPIGELKANYFSGHFDGDGHTISNLNVKTIDDANALYAGVFGRVYDGTIKNLNVDGVKLVSAKYAGGIAGLLNGAKNGDGYAAITNCHVTNAEIYGLQIGGVAGRSDTTGATKGTFVIEGSSANNITFGIVTADDFPTIDNGNHFIGGIVGGAGATIIDGCYATNITANAYATSFAPVGGIVGVHGAGGTSSDVTNCYVIGVNFSAVAESHPDKTSLGGLIGKIGHVQVAAGDPNTESNIFNCFVSDVTINNATSSINNGVVAGLVNDTIFFNDIYYVPEAGLESYGYDQYFSDYPFIAVNALSDLKAENLNKGNSTAVWVDDLVLGHPVIDIDAVIANEPAFVDYYVEHAGDTTEEITTDAPEVTTDKPDGTDEPTAEPTTAPDEPTNAPGDATNAPGGDNQSTTEEKKGCGGMIAGGVVVVALLGTAVVFKKRK